MAGENVTTVDVNELPLPRLTQIKQELDTQVEIFGSSLQQLKIAQKKYGDSKECVERMQNMKKGNSLLVPLTDSVSFKRKEKLVKKAFNLMLCSLIIWPKLVTK
ncbi:uncharacterized protein TNIN_94371 [Trichonephila inaurata madagascariensis]|uniref:Uncharacterized protein n=1 Tax=Trichonephila inaurata madagascariensis TaxID=2747483 RepID=A0A8X6XRI5_9ARAC|nr:uncharacterized protein TNIN_94371 [Trichonephila inaurata madagascariensis]